MKTPKAFPIRLFLAGLLSVAMLPATAPAVSVNLELALVVDESGSIDASEYALQKQGYVVAFQDPAVQAAIAAIQGGIAVTFIQFDADVQTGIGWTHITDASSANAFATALNNLPRFGNVGTGVANAIRYAYAQFGTEVGLAGNGFESSRQVIDVSGDGANNQNENSNGDATDLVTDVAILAGIDRINGLVISPNDEAGLLNFYQTQVQDGPGAFTVVADDFNDFAQTARDKIFVEVVGVPEGGSTLAYSFIGAIALGLAARKRREARA